MTSVKALWTSKSTFISMTLNSLPIKDKSPFHTRSSICQCHHTKERGNLFMPNMPPVSNFGRPFEHCFLIKRGPLSSLFFFFLTGMSLWYHFPQLEIVTITYLSITVLLWLPSGCHSTLLSSSSHHVPAKRKSDTWVCIETALTFPITRWQERGDRWLLSASWGNTHRLERNCGVAAADGGRGSWWVEQVATRMDGAGPTPLIPYLGCLPLHIDRRVDWGLRLAATFSQKAREIQYWEWMATSCCQCCNLGNRQSTILVPPLATGMGGKTNWIFTAYGLHCSHTCRHKKVNILYIRALSRTSACISLSSLSINILVHLHLKHVSRYGQAEVKWQRRLGLKSCQHRVCTCKSLYFSCFRPQWQVKTQRLRQNNTSKHKLNIA